ncbi:V-type ATPase subunit [Paractinoplanes hotanensis]|uniref:V-type ATPase subunit n=1 Tax=Paractinoplanes hotanensis TaxID=2906497 RepID=A0ABT0YEY8_9ACTN|nr:V-type ATPase subunit [Actinoplanes hotanensis]MCM4084360.1 V-type ATPase subunit [Actinoplanes hotanensis]
MTAGWVAGSVRATAMARRRLGAVAARELATCPGLPAALEVLARSPYGRDVGPADTLASAERAVEATTLWNLRVLAGWLPAEGAGLFRLLAGWFEIANIDEHLSGFAADPLEAGVPPFRLGSLATAWPRLSRTSSPAELRAALAASAWGDPGADTHRAISTWLRISWATRVSADIEPARPWAAGAVALLVARELVATGNPRPGVGTAAVIGRLLGAGWSGATGLADLARRLPVSARWALDEVTDPSDLWLAEIRWWARLRRDGTALALHPAFGRRRPLGAAVVLAADAWLVTAALELAARGGADREVWDALA